MTHHAAALCSACHATPAHPSTGIQEHHTTQPHHTSAHSRSPHLTALYSHLIPCQHSSGQQPQPHNCTQQQPQPHKCIGQRHTLATSASAGLCWLAACSTSAAIRATAVSPAAAVVQTTKVAAPTLMVPAWTALPGRRAAGADSPAAQQAPPHSTGKGRHVGIARGSKRCGAVNGP
jgi:hypothetical protein